MQRLLFAAGAVLFHLQPFRVVFFVLPAAVVPLLALRAGQMYRYAHLYHLPCISIYHKLSRHVKKQSP